MNRPSAMSARAGSIRQGRPAAWAISYPCRSDSLSVDGG